MLTIVVRVSSTTFGGITMLSIGPSPTGSAWITWAFMDLANSLVLSGIAGGSGILSGVTRLSGVTGLSGLPALGGTAGTALTGRRLSLPNLECKNKI